MTTRPTVEEVAIVLRGDFNPLAFQPRWFIDQGIIRMEEAASAEIQVFHSSAVAFRANWLNVLVDAQRFQVTTFENAYYEPLRDVSLSVLRIVEDADPSLLGINRVAHFSTDSREEWDRVGHRAIPKENWANVLEKAGTVSAVIEGVRPDAHHGYIRVRTEPSTRVEHGIFIDVNDHFELRSEAKSGERSRLAQQILEESWLESIQRSQDISQSVLAWRRKR